MSLLPSRRLVMAGVVAAAVTVAPMSAAAAMTTKDKPTMTPAGKGIGRKAH